jgi:hypothetical protein
MSNRWDKPTREFYLDMLPTIREIAKRHGYAIGVHGSLERDFDLIAAAWVEQPSSPTELVEAIRIAFDGVLVKGGKENTEPTVKPHGRLAWSISVGRSRYIDLSVMAGS